MMAKTTPPTLTLNNGVAMPVLGLGVFQEPAGGDDCRGRDRGRGRLRLIDTAASYDNEREVGALDTGVRGGPDPEKLNTTTYPKTVEN
jgi:diketogulonate reductase-like aldo/keto reductase